MGYSESPRAVTDIADALEPLKQLAPCSWRSNSRLEQKRWAYKVRQALYVARIYPEKFPELAKAATRYSIVENKDTFETMAVLSAPIPEAQVLHAATTGRPTPIQGTLSPGAIKEIAGAHTAVDVVEAMSRHRGSNDPVHFPDAGLSEPELLKVYKWAMKREPFPYMLLQPEGSNSLTILPWDDEAAKVGANWTPDRGIGE